LAHHRIERRHFAIGLAERPPDPRHLRRRRSERVLEHARRVDGSLSDRILLQLSVFRIAPRSLVAVALFRADGKRLKPELIVDLPIQQNVALTFVCNETVELRIKKNRVADRVARQVRIEMHVQPDFSRRASKIPDLDAAKKKIAIEIDGVADRHFEIERWRARVHARHQRVVVVFERFDPGRIADPSEFAVAPNAEKRDVADRLIVLTDVRPVHVADVVVMIKIDHEIAVGDRQVARHVESVPLSWWTWSRSTSARSKPARRNASSRVRSSPICRATSWRSASAPARFSTA